MELLSAEGQGFLKVIEGTLVYSVTLGDFACANHSFEWALWYPEEDLNPFVGYDSSLADNDKLALGFGQIGWWPRLMAAARTSALGQG